jgi:succinoglycan biosynthesis protein ExoM
MNADSVQSQKIGIDVLVCTYRRPAIREALLSINAQKLPSVVSVRVIVADNDDEPSAANEVARAASDMTVPVLYVHAPSRNISIARNACLDHAGADWVVFFDDDEQASPGWLAALLEASMGEGADGAFGPVVAQYGDDTPGWICDYDYLSTRPQTRGGEVQTGYTGNAILRWRGARYTRERFSLEKGKTGGEDTEFFFRLWRLGARFAVAENAIVFEHVEPARLAFDWIQKRKYRAGQSYGRHCTTPSSLSFLRLAAVSSAKIALCFAMSGLRSFSISKRRFWLLRGVFHAGVLSSALGATEDVSYGK